jgi:hypothetical protein
MFGCGCIRWKMPGAIMKAFLDLCAFEGRGDDSTLVVESEAVHFFLRECGAESRLLSKQHLSFEVESLDTVIEALNEMAMTDYHVGEVGFFTHKNYRWCQWEDPNGIQLECVEVV